MPKLVNEHKKDFTVSFFESNAAMAPSYDAELNDVSMLTDGYMPADPSVAPSPSSEAVVPQWNDFKRFQVFSASGGNVIYANGIQQIKLMVVVQAVDDDQKVVEISNSELDSIQLVDAYTNKALPIDIIREAEEPVWKCLLERRQPFQPFPHTGEMHGPSPRGRGIVLKEFYVSSNAVESIKLFVAITRSDGEIFQSDPESEFGEIKLKAIPSPNYRKEHFRVKHLSSYWQATEHVAKVDRYVLDLLVDQQYIKFVNCNFAGLLHSRSEHSDYLGYYAVGYFEGRQVEHAQWVSWETADAVAKAHEEKGKVTLLMHFARKGGKSQIRYDRLSVKMFVMDMYGNKHEVDISMDPAKSSMIEVN